MKEILFRGKDIDNDEWVEGYLTVTNFPTGEWVKCIDYLIDRYTIREDYGQTTVVPETITQYIGFTDKNKRKIFECDIIKLYLIDGFEIGVIKYNDIMCRFMFFTKEGSYSFDNTTECEVIGNIYDNPELLEN